MAKDSQLSDSCSFDEKSSGSIKLERSATVGDHCSIAGDLHLLDRAQLGAHCGISGTLKISADAAVNSQCIVSGSVSIGPRTTIGIRCELFGPISIGRDVVIGDGVAIYADSLSNAADGPGVVIEPTAMIHSGATLLPGTVIGAGSIIESGAKVRGRIPSDCRYRADGSIEFPRSVELHEPKLEPENPRALEPNLVDNIFAINPSLGSSRYRFRISRELLLDVLLENKKTDTLIVSFHGAVDRKRGALPRFEWLNTLHNRPFSTLYFSDPALSTHPDLRLGWFLGTEETNLHKLLSTLIHHVQVVTEARNILLLGLSGGGFAAHQVSRYLPNSVALVFNPRTEIPVAQEDGSIWWTFYSYLKAAAPNLAPRQARAELLGEYSHSDVSKRVSARKAYASPTSNKVLYFTNVDESYHKTEFLPFSKSVHPQNDVEFREYSAGSAHTAPSAALFNSALDLAVSKFEIPNSNQTLEG